MAPDSFVVEVEVTSAYGISIEIDLNLKMIFANVARVKIASIHTFLGK